VAGARTSCSSLEQRGTALAMTEFGGLVVPEFSPSPAPQRLRLDWSSWIVIAAIVLLLLAFGLYFYAG
jgi:hypothetical protein